METPDKKDQLRKGFYYEVTDEQIRQHQQRSIKQILNWIESTQEFIYRFQTPEERERMKKIKNGEF